MFEATAWTEYFNLNSVGVLEPYFQKKDYINIRKYKQSIGLL